MVQRMNQSADPCSDFWSYSCGGWSISKLRTDQLDNSCELHRQYLAQDTERTAEEVAGSVRMPIAQYPNNRLLLLT
ncbi:hypothetical protein PR048_025796 [Dryococelus australis]|uniref:Peptidase M13 N-terminal domain-containing protein n=1 Tax=Dryococelus australis TaxID=614101 RepID=A0ABQ9GJL8_9NEOP|nr:hypothetical protein PR048_025796 [Dryococelus australis]